MLSFESCWQWRSSQRRSLVSSLCRYRALTFVLTFLLYTSFHLSRKPISIVKVTHALRRSFHPPARVHVFHLALCFLFAHGVVVVLNWQSELHRNCSSVSELATIAFSSGQQPPQSSLHTDMDCSWKPFGSYVLLHSVVQPRMSRPKLFIFFYCQIKGTTSSCWEPWTTPSSVPMQWECTSGEMN